MMLFFLFSFSLFFCPYVLRYSHPKGQSRAIMNNWPHSRRQTYQYIVSIKEARASNINPCPSREYSSSKQSFAQYIRGQDMIYQGHRQSFSVCRIVCQIQNLLMLVSKIRVGAQDRSSPPRGYDSHRATYCPPIISTGNNNKYRLVCAENKRYH